MQKNLEIASLRCLLVLTSLCLLAAIMAGGADLGKSTVQGTILKVLPSPGMWTGTVESVQWFEMKVVKSRVSTIKPDTVLHIGVPLVMGNRLFNQQKREFSSDKIAPGKLVEVRLSAKCSKRQDAVRYIVEPNCVRALK
jgi:hypothetical protein